MIPLHICPFAEAPWTILNFTGIQAVDKICTLYLNLAPCMYTNQYSSIKDVAFGHHLKLLMEPVSLTQVKINLLMGADELPKCIH